MNKKKRGKKRDTCFQSIFGKKVPEVRPLGGKRVKKGVKVSAIDGLKEKR